MVVYDVELIKIEPVYGEAKDQIIEMWAAFRIDKYEIETFLDNYYVVPRKDLLEGIGRHFNINIVLMAYDLYRINIEEKMLKQITKFPGEDKYGRGWPPVPMYFIMGEVVDLKEREKESWSGEVKRVMWLKIDCGIEIETTSASPYALELVKGDYVAIIGKMFGEIVHDANADKG